MAITVLVGLVVLVVNQGDQEKIVAAVVANHS